MFIDGKITHEAANEAYCLLMAYTREEKIAATYDVERIKTFVKFLADILKYPGNFVNEPKKESVKEKNDEK